MRVRFAFATAVALAIPGALPLVRSSLTPGTGAVVPRAAPGAGACCLPLPVVATSKDPAKGRVHQELGLADLEALFSNRHVMFAGGWEDAFVVLAHEIDPSNRYRMWDRPAPPIARQIPLVEGGLSGSLAGRPPPRDPANPWARVTDTALPTVALVNTLARINKYGEPAAGLREASLLAARFLVDGLVRIPTAVANQDQNALRLLAAGTNARVMLRNIIASGRPELVARRTAAAARRVEQEKAAGELFLDDADLANAALDVLRSVDDNGNRSGLFALRRDLDEDAIFEDLVIVASAGLRFGGTAPPGSPQDSVACRAFSTLVDFADVHTGGAAALRDRLLSLYLSEVLLIGLPAARPPVLAVARTAIIMTGVESPDEAKALVQRVFAIGTGARSNARRTEVINALKGLAGRAGGVARDTERKVMAEAAEAWFELLEKRQDAGTGGPDELLLLDAWRAGGDATLAELNPECAPDPGEAKPRIFLYVVTAEGLQVVGHPYLGVAMVIEAQYNPPAGQSAVTLDVQLGSGKEKMPLKRIDSIGYIYRSDPFVPGESTLKREDVFNPPPPPRRGGRQ